MKLYQTIQGEMIDAICYNIFGFESGFLEEVLEMNPGIAALDDPLPAGIIVKVAEKLATKTGGYGIMGLNMNLVTATGSIMPRFSLSIFNCWKIRCYKNSTNNAFETIKI